MSSFPKVDPVVIHQAAIHKLGEKLIQGEEPGKLSPPTRWAIEKDPSKFDWELWQWQPRSILEQVFGAKVASKLVDEGHIAQAEDDDVPESSRPSSPVPSRGRSPTPPPVRRSGPKSPAPVSSPGSAKKVPVPPQSGAQQVPKPTGQGQVATYSGVTQNKLSSAKPNFGYNKSAPKAPQVPVTPGVPPIQWFTNLVRNPVVPPTAPNWVKWNPGKLPEGWYKRPDGKPDTNGCLNLKLLSNDEHDRWNELGWGDPRFCYKFFTGDCELDELCLFRHIPPSSFELQALSWWNGPLWHSLKLRYIQMKKERQFTKMFPNEQVCRRYIPGYGQEAKFQNFQGR